MNEGKAGRIFQARGREYAKDLEKVVAVVGSRWVTRETELKLLYVQG